MSRARGGASLVLLGVLLLLGARRGLPWRARQPPSCPFPFAVRSAGELRVLCSSSPRQPADLLLARMDLPPCRSRLWLEAGTLLEMPSPCALSVARLPGLTRLALGLPLDLNRASAADLEALPRVGPVLARRILEERRRRAGFPDLGSLVRVRGIGPATLKRLRPWLCVGGSCRRY